MYRVAAPSKRLKTISRSFNDYLVDRVACTTSYIRTTGTAIMVSKQPRGGDLLGDKRITNAYTESVNGVAKGINRLGRGYSFDVLRARLLYQKTARAASAQRIREAVAEDDGDGTFLKMFVMERATGAPSRKRMRHVERIVEYGPSMDVLAKMLADGESEDKA